MDGQAFLAVTAGGHVWGDARVAHPTPRVVALFKSVTEFFFNAFQGPVRNHRSSFGAREWCCAEEPSCEVSISYRQRRDCVAVRLPHAIAWHLEQYCGCG